MAPKKRIKPPAQRQNRKLKTTAGDPPAAADASKTAQPAKPKEGPGADRALLEYVEMFRYGPVRPCTCETHGRCIHSNSLTSLAREMFWNFRKIDPDRYRQYEMPEELQTMRKEVIRKESALDKLQETIIGMLPQAKRGRLRGLLDRYESEFENLKIRFFMAVGYARGLTDHEDLTCYRLGLIEQLIGEAKNKKSRPYYDRVYFSNAWDIGESGFSEKVANGNNNDVQPGLLARRTFFEISSSIDQLADELAREYKKNKDPRVLKEQLDLMETAKRLRAEQDRLPGY